MNWFYIQRILWNKIKRFDATMKRAVKEYPLEYIHVKEKENQLKKRSRGTSICATK